MFSLMMLFAAQEPQSSDAPIAVSEPPAAIALAELPLMRSSRTMAAFSEAGKAAGHTGMALVEAIFKPDGVAESVKIVESSRSDLLDAEALAAVGEATIAAGPEARRVLLTVQFDPTGILETKCDEFVRQVRWYEAAWPERTREDARIYTATVGALALAKTQSGGVNAALEMARQTDKIRAAYDATVEQCESRPEQSYLQVMSRLMR